MEINFEAYLQGFSANIKDIIDNFDFTNTVKLMVKGGVLFVTLQEFNSARAICPRRKSPPLTWAISLRN